MRHLMLDLETLGTRVNCPVIAIGAVFFDPETGDLGATFDRAIDLADAMEFGRADGNTVKWWMDQGDAARKQVIRGQEKAQKVFADFHAFISRNSSAEVVPWGNGASFDISILDYAFPRILNVPPPWKFWNVRDCRTIKAIAEGVLPDYPHPREGVHHSALDDAVYQAKWVSHFWRGLRYGELPIQKASVPLALDL
jgi:hypothetical protein